MGFWSKMVSLGWDVPNVAGGLASSREPTKC